MNKLFTKNNEMIESDFKNNFTLMKITNQKHITQKPKHQTNRIVQLNRVNITMIVKYYTKYDSWCIIKLNYTT